MSPFLGGKRSASKPQSESSLSPCYEDRVSLHGKVRLSTFIGLLKSNLMLKKSAFLGFLEPLLLLDMSTLLFDIRTFSINAREAKVKFG